MTNVTLVAEVTFHPDSWLRFPLSQPLRLSLWPAANPVSAPAEFRILAPLRAGAAYTLRIDTLLLPGLEALMQPGAAIRFGMPPTRIAGAGRILRLEF
ncbi:hypothetical protein EJV47_22175 [Hymenobacter gummosus]|uniref:Uncharacterized protein n=1 Tax=Hymenobacter gummosus TaxID=1776032 RepID=A0A431TWW2_9BACT|nr:hypothetical protein [Hymenobacter gummosus]RTQ46239.1 hypothetical protein EJV47_22175 [Hymenobacter gummosus]